YGDADPAFSATISGFKNGETLATSGVTGGASLSANDTATSPVGTYTITPAQGTLRPTNHHFTTLNTRTLTVPQANATILRTPYSVIYNGAPHPTTGTAKGVLGESLGGLNLGGTTHTYAGDYPADSWTFTDVNGNYNNANGTVHDRITLATGSAYILNPTAGG